MPEFIVHFGNPVVYLDGHHKARVVTELSVHAPDARGAEFHAIRTVTGDFGSIHAELKSEDPPAVPAPEEYTFICSICGVERGEEHVCMEKVN